MKPYYKLLALFFLLPVLASAQAKYLPGVAVKINGDTLHGYIDYRDWENNPKSIRFKYSQTGDGIELNVNNTRYFSVNSDHLSEYERYAGSISMNQTAINQLINGRDTSSRQDTVFLRVLQRGKNIVLFSYTDGFKTRFFIEEVGSDTIKELIYRIYWNTDSGTNGNRTVYENTYQKQFYQLAQKFNAVSDNLSTYIEKSEYKEDQLIAVAGKINNVSDTDSKKNSPTKTKKASVIFAVAGGVLLAILTIIQFTSQKH